MKIPSQLVIILGFALMLGLLLLTALFGWRQIHSNQQGMEAVVRQYSAKVARINTLRHIARERAVTIFHMLIAKDPFLAGTLRSRMGDLASEFIATVEELRAMELSTQERDAIVRLQKQAGVIAALHFKIIEHIENNEFDPAYRVALDQQVQEQEKLMAIYTELIAIENKSTEQALDAARSSYHQALNAMLTLGIATIGLGLLISIFVIRNTLRIEHHLYALNNTLEQRVAQRTEDLEHANQALQRTITELKTTQEQLVQAEKMASLGNLVAGMAHEINTPLGVSVTSASSMQVETTQLRAALNAGSVKRSELLSYMQCIEQSCSLLLNNLRRASSLISSFKLVAVDQSSEDWRAINLHEYVGEIITSLHPRLKKTVLTIKNECEATGTLYTNPGALYQILSNFIMNSLTHAFEPGQTGHIRIKSWRDDSALYLEYRDDGKGIPPSHLSRIFEPFFTTRRGAGGSGLGLHIVYNLVTGTLKGTISVKSALGAGVIFKLKLPLGQGSPHVSPTP